MSLADDFAARGINRSQMAQFLEQHGHGGALKSVTKTVHRQGKTFQQTFHVDEKPAAKSDNAPATGKGAEKPTSSAQRKASTTPKTADAVIKAAGADPATTKRYIDKWVEHSGSSASLSLRSAWAQQSGVKLDEGRMLKIHAHANGKADVAAAKAAIEQGRSPVVQAAAKAIAHASQQAYAGQSQVEVHRGITGEQARLIKEAIARGDKTVKLAVDSASSFTDDRKIAVQFAKGTGGSYKGTDATHGVVVKFKAPVSSILASHRAFPRQFDKKEKEVVIASHGMIEIPVSDIETFGK